MSDFLDWRNRMLQAVWRQEEALPEEVSAWMSETYEEFGEIPEDEFCELWTTRTFSMARSAFEVIQNSVFDETGKRVVGEEFSYVNYFRDPEFGPVGVVRFKSAEVSTPDWAEVLGVVAEGVQEFVMDYHATVWPVCSRHTFGMHVDYFDETAVWKCNGGPAGGHVVRAVDPTDDGKIYSSRSPSRTRVLQPAADRPTRPAEVHGGQAESSAWSSRWSS